MAFERPPKWHLTRIPGELRNRIYALVFAPGHEEVDLLGAVPPSKDLALTCRQIYQESKGLYKAAYRAFWADTVFIARNNYPSAMAQLRTALASINDADIAAIRNIHVHGYEAKWVMHGDTWYTGTRRGGLHAWLVVPRNGERQVPAELQRHYLHCGRSCSIVWATKMSAAEKEEARVKIGRAVGLSRYEMDVMLGFEQKRDQGY